jgi:hypothetical protein
MSELFDEAVAGYRARLFAAVEQMRQATSPGTFATAERHLVDLARELAAGLTQRVLQDISDDAVRRRDALQQVRTSAARRGITMKTQSDRTTPVRTLGGQEVEVRTAYAAAQPRGGARAVRGADGTGVYYVLDQLGITDRSTPALRLLVSHAVAEANSVTSARDLLAGTGVCIDHKAALRLTYHTCQLALQARTTALRDTTAGEIERIEASVRALGGLSPEEQATEQAYWSRNRERLRYARFRSSSLPVGSGAVESAVRRVISLRMKGASIRWTEEHAEGMLHLRAQAKSGRWAELEEIVLRNSTWQPTSRMVRKTA